MPDELPPEPEDLGAIPTVDGPLRSDGLQPVPDDLSLGVTVRGFIEGQRLFERYVLQRILGRGGMGVVWLAHDEHLQEDVALKFLPELVRLDTVSVEELKRETRRSRKLAHPHIVKVYDFAADATTAAISMEYVDGLTLSALRAQKEHLCFDVGEVSAWVYQLCAALAYAHGQAKIVHRDLKLANVMIDRDGQVKVTDFGISSSISESVSRVTVKPGTSGTLAYMSPQQARGMAPSAGDDIYALGATLFELLTGKPPFYRGEIMHQLLHEQAPTLTERRAELGVEGAPIPPEWESTIAACLAKEPADRPQSVVEVVQRLGLGTLGGYTPATTAEVPQTEPAPLPEPPPKHSGKGLVIAGLVALVLLLGGLGYYFGIYQPAEQARQAQIAKQEADAAAAEQAKEKADADAAQAAAQAKADADRAALEKAKEDADAKAAAAEAEKEKADAAAAQAKAEADAQAKAEADQKAAAAAAAQAANYPQSGQPWTNSLGVKFVPAGTDGVLFSVWDVRVKDYQTFVTATGHDWPKANFTQTENDPAVMVSWNDAHAFCDWLTKKEQSEGKLGPNQSYRLPTDEEWSMAVGLNESSEGAPKDKDGKITGVYPWGTQWPPPSGAGNYYGEENKKLPLNGGGMIAGYNDDYVNTSPVGSFNPNSYGLYDVGGNVWQWCEDKYDPTQEYRVLRGASWLNGAAWTDKAPQGELSSTRNYVDPDRRLGSYGFRVVVALNSPASSSAAPAAASSTNAAPAPLPQAIVTARQQAMQSAQTADEASQQALQHAEDAELAAGQARSQADQAKTKKAASYADTAEDAEASAKKAAQSADKAAKDAEAAQASAASATTVDDAQSDAQQALGDAQQAMNAAQNAEQAAQQAQTAESSATRAAQAAANAQDAAAQAPAESKPVSKFAGTWVGRLDDENFDTTLTIDAEERSVKFSVALEGTATDTYPVQISGNTLTFHPGSGFTWTIVPNSDVKTALIKAHHLFFTNSGIFTRQ